MTKNKFIVSLIFSLVALPLLSQNTRMLTADKNNEYGIVYSLPLTELHIDLSATFTERKAGPFREYAPRYLGNIDVIESDSRSVAITSAKLSTSGRSSDEKYLMTLKPGALMEVCVDESGMLLAINEQVDDQSLEPLTNPQPAARPDMDEYLQYVDEDFLVSLSQAKKAQMLARTIMEIRDSRLALSRGTAETMPTDGRQLELMLQSLEKQENALMRAFTGYEYTVTRNRRIDLLPDSAMIEGSRNVIARIAADEDFTGSDDLVGAPIYLTFSNLTAPEMPVNAKGEPKSLPKDAVIYRLPATVDLKLEFEGSTLLAESVNLAQGGEVFGLDPKLFTDKKQPSYAIFDSSTGALLKVATIASKE